VNKFHKCSESKILSEAQKLRSNFIDDNSFTQVNLDVQTVKNIRKSFEEGKIDRHVFDEAQQYIFELMQNDSYRRFIRSKYNVFSKSKKLNSVEDS
jgi:regulator of G-protein signaling